jgi:uncharacterized protein (DUF1778 family)
MRQGRSPLAMRLTEDGKKLLEMIAERRGVSLTAVVEQLVRDEAERRGLLPAPSPVARQQVAE